MHLTLHCQMAGLGSGPELGTLESEKGLRINVFWTWKWPEMVVNENEIGSEWGWLDSETALFSRLTICYLIIICNTHELSNGHWGCLL